MEEKKSNPLKIFLYISAWVIIWGTFGSFIDFPLYKNNIYQEGSIYQYLTFTITAIISIFSAKIEDYSTFLPSRLVLITLPLVSSKIKKYIFIIKKSYLDGSKYDSPNSGISEATFAYTTNIKLGGESKSNEQIIEKPLINPDGDICTKEKIYLICQLILRLQILWIFFFTIIFFNI